MSRIMSQSISDSSLDFLGRPPSRDSNESSDTNVRSEATSTSLDFLGRPPSQEPNESDNPSEPKRSVRKQAKPRKHGGVIREIIRLQNTTNLLISRLPFQRLVREIQQKYMQDGRIQRTALEALQESAEYFLLQLFEDAYLVAMHTKRVTLKKEDLRLTLLLNSFKHRGDLIRG